MSVKVTRQRPPTSVNSLCRWWELQELLGTFPWHWVWLHLCGCVTKEQGRAGAGQQLTRHDVRYPSWWCDWAAQSHSGGVLRNPPTSLWFNHLLLSSLLKPEITSRPKTWPQMRCNSKLIHLSEWWAPISISGGFTFLCCLFWMRHKQMLPWPSNDSIKVTVVV